MQASTNPSYEIKRDGVWLPCESATEIKSDLPGKPMLLFTTATNPPVRGMTSQWRKVKL